MQYDTQSKEVVGIVKNFYKEEMGLLDIGLNEICFCPNSPSCMQHDCSPITIPRVDDNKVEIHINSEIRSRWYPIQIVYQLSHELWHAYEFSRFGIQYSWHKFQKETEPFAHAATLCVLSQNIIPEKFLNIQLQINYFNNCKHKDTGDPIYDPGIKIARDINYNFKELTNLYRNKIIPLIEKS